MDSKQQLLDELQALRAENKRLIEQLHLYNSTTTNRTTGIDHFKTLGDNFPVIIWTTRPDGSVDYFNTRFYEYTGLNAEQALGWGWTAALHPDDLIAATEAWNRSVKRGTQYEIEYRLKRKVDDSWRWHLAKGVPVKNTNGEIVKWFGANTDIHEQKEVENAKDEFLSVASHELKTPLTSLKAFLQLGEKKVSPDESSYLFIEKARQQSDRLEMLIANLLDISKINAGKMIYDKAEFEFDVALQEAVENFQLTTPDHHIILEQNAKVVYNGDRLRIEQVITNFLSNAVKYSPGKDKVIIRSQIHQDNIVVSVQDFGIGIEPQNLHNLFNRYYRVDNRSTQFQGLGLGLFIASDIIKRHNGSFWIESAPEEGSTFYFLLPINGKQELIDIDTDNQTYYKGNFIEINYNPDKKRIESNWLGYQNYDSVKKGCMIMLDLLAKNNCTKVLNDNTYVIGNWSEAVDWGSDYWFPAMQAAGLKHFAWIYSPSAFSRMSAQKSIDVILGQITARFFTEKNEAVAWLDVQ